MNIYQPNTPLKQILTDGWARGFEPEQTIREASAAGFARCVVEPLLPVVWASLDRAMLTHFKELELTHSSSAPTSPVFL